MGEEGWWRGESVRGRGGMVEGRECDRGRRDGEGRECVCVYEREVK